MRAARDPQEQMRCEADAVLRLYGEMLRRLSQQGVRSVAELAALQQQVCRAAAAVAMQELDFAIAQLASLVERLRAVGIGLERLGEMKRALGPPDGADAGA